MRLDLINNILEDGTQIKRAIKQGNDYRIIIRYPANLTNAVFLGEIRDAPLDSDGVVLATFAFGSPSFDGTHTEVTASIVGEETELIPFTKYNYTINQFSSDGVLIPAQPDPPSKPATEKNCWLYDLKAIDSGNEIGLIDYGLVQVIARYTEG